MQQLQSLEWFLRQSFGYAGPVIEEKLSELSTEMRQVQKKLEDYPFILKLFELGKREKLKNEHVKLLVKCAVYKKMRIETWTTYRNQLLRVLRDEKVASDEDLGAVFGLKAASVYVLGRKALTDCELSKEFFAFEEAEKQKCGTVEEAVKNL
jgi:hypothetical protein